MVITFLGTKGGTGTTTLAVNTAAEIRRQAERPTVVLDLKPGPGDVGLFLGLRSRFTLIDLIDQAGWLDPAVVPALLPRHECGLHVVLAPDEYGRPSPADGDGLERVMRLLLDAFEFVVVDAGSSLHVWSSLVLRASDLVMLVANPDVPCLRNLQRLRGIVRRAGIPDERVRMVLNRTAGVEVLSVRQIEEVLGVHVDHRFTSDYRTVAAALNTGVPVAWVRPSVLKAELEQFAHALLAALPVEPSGSNSH